jgi:hypothetical protein
VEELISGQLILNLNWPRVTREHVNHPMKISKISTMCQIMNDLKYTCPMTCVCEFFRIYRELLLSIFEASGFLLFRLVGTSEAQSSEATIRDLPFKTQGLWNLGDR